MVSTFNGCQQDYRKNYYLNR